ncbi:MAG: chromate transporter, partial [Christensenellaceae bacterium]|nr:chromate transporter [Christensenellaceae bacterium]
MIYLTIFWEFLKVGCFSFGGAYFAIPLIRQIVLSNGWMTEDV